MSNGKTFIRVTNQDIYLEIKNLEKNLDCFKLENVSQHNDIKKCHLNNKSQINVIRWISTSALGISVFIIVGLITQTI